MLTSITLRNYRVIGERGVTIPLDRQFVGLVGVNNAGKSTALRALFELRGMFTEIAYTSLDPLAQLLSRAGLHAGREHGLPPGERIFPAGNDAAEPRITLAFDGHDPRDVAELTIVLGRDGQSRGTLRTGDGRLIGGATSSQVRYSTGGAVILLAIEGSGAVEFDPRALFLDLRPLTQSLYVGAFRNAINAGGGDYYDLTVGRAFVARFDEFQNGPDHEANDAVNEMLGELASIIGVQQLEVRATSQNDGLLYSIDRRSFRDSEVGAGVAQFVIVAANVLVSRPAILLIDEPELNLHASLQLKFLTMLARYTAGPVIFSTHSMGLARSAADHVLVIERTPAGPARGEDWKAVGNLSSVIGELGYGGFNDTAHRVVLLVEGVTDVRTFHELLRQRGVRHEVVVVPLGGDDLVSGGRGVELADLKRLSDHVFAVVDGEAQSPDGPPARRRAAFAEDCAAQGITCHLLERRAIENYLDQEVAREVMGTPDAGAFDVHDKPWRGWVKDRNWRVAQRMPEAALEGTDLGGVLARVVVRALGHDGA